MAEDTDKTDFGNTQELANDMWLFLTSDKMPNHAKISKEAFIHEVRAMIEAVREYERNKYLETMPVMNSEQFQKFIERKFGDKA